MSTCLHEVTAQTDVLATLQPRIEQLARNLYYRVCGYVSISLDDLTQEGLIAAWRASERYDAEKVTNEYSACAFCLAHARGAMLRYLDRLNKTSSTSLDEYLEVETKDGTMQREIADKPVEHRQATLAERRRILAAMRYLTERERLCVMAHYHIDDAKTGHSLTSAEVRTRLGMTYQAYDSAKRRALAKLARVLSGEQLPCPRPSKPTPHYQTYQSLATNQPPVSTNLGKHCYICRKDIRNRVPGARYDLPVGKIVVCCWCHLHQSVDEHGAIHQREVLTAQQTGVWLQARAQSLLPAYLS